MRWRIVVCLAWLAAGLLTLGDRLAPLWQSSAEYQFELENGTVHTVSNRLPARDVEAVVAVALLDDIEKLVRQARYVDADLARLSFRRSQKQIVTALQEHDRNRSMMAWAAMAFILLPLPFFLLIGQRVPLARFAYDRIAAGISFDAAWTRTAIGIAAIFRSRAKAAILRLFSMIAGPSQPRD